MVHPDDVAPRVPPQRFTMKWRRSWHVVAAGVSVALAGGELLRRSTWPIGGWVTIACGVVLAVWFGQPAWRRAPMLWFDDDGLRARIPGVGPIAWHDIERLRLVRANGQSFLVIDRVAEERRRRPPSMLAAAIAKKPEAKDLAVPLDNLETAPDKVFAVVDLAHRHATGRT
jgi:hypothetical protein